MQTEKKARHAKTLSSKVEVQLLKEQKQNILKVSESHEKILKKKYKIWIIKFNL
jgi:hypothetical protein